MSTTLSTRTDWELDPTFPSGIYVGQVVRVGNGTAPWSVERVDCHFAEVCSAAGMWRTVPVDRLRPANLAPSGPYDPWVHARAYEEMGWTIAWEPLPFHTNGYTKFSLRAIKLADDLLTSEARFTLAHELVHVERGYTHRTSERAIAADELAVDNEAARRLIPFGELVKAAMWASCLDELADELAVSEDAVEVRLKALSRDERRQLQAASLTGVVSRWCTK